MFEISNGIYGAKQPVMKRIETSKSQSIQVVYTDLKGDIQKVTSCLIGGIVKAHDSDIAHALSLMLY